MCSGFISAVKEDGNNAQESHVFAAIYSVLHSTFFNTNTHIHPDRVFLTK